MSKKESIAQEVIVHDYYTGPGINPSCGLVRSIFTKDTHAGNAYKGQAWLFLGVANFDIILYDDE